MEKRDEITGRKLKGTNVLNKTKLSKYELEEFMLDMFGENEENNTD